ncbi:MULTISPECIES: hypothetical protein [unclassified Streptomyces]|uniref:hypothetical protein n=1 Tax=unclassified Streptomyces TaxID=2593676 RepID=UPI002E2F310C|nr:MULTISPECIES: hypothetical protein [unclassified Streptomyces]
MSAAAIPVPVWWGIVTAGTAVFLATLVSWMPTRGLRARMLLAPVFIAAFAAVRYYAEDMRADQVLSMYALVVLAFPLGLLGRRRELARIATAGERGAVGQEQQWSATMAAQFLIVLSAAMGLWLWLVW